jgi:hypothetical protein
MFILGHCGIAAAIVYAVDKKADLRLVLFAAMLPDLIDKPLALVAPSFANGWTRLVAHGLTGLAVFSIVAILLWREKAWAPILGWLLHLVLDRMWEDVHILFWPFAGFFFAQHPKSFMERWWEKFHDPWTICGEAVGLLALVTLSVRGRLWERRRRLAFLASGILAEPERPS